MSLTFTPSPDGARELAAGSGIHRVPIACEIFADVRTPIEVMRIIRGVSSHCYLLESAEPAGHWGRYSFLGYDPAIELTCRDHVLAVNGEKHRVEHPATVIREILAAHRAPQIEGLPTFAGGLVGYFSYDYLKYSEPSLRLDAADDEGFNDCDLMLFETVIAFDHYRQKIVLIANMDADADDFEAAYEEACGKLEAMRELILHGTPIEDTHGTLESDFRKLFDHGQYCEIVEKTKRFIREGDIFQAVLSNRMDADFEGSLLDCYRMLRTSNPSPYMFYFTSDSIELAGASPETLGKLEDGVLHTFPLAGTRPRGATPEEDAALEAGLLADKKELAEHNMLVDLGRNDLGKVSRFGTVELERYHEVLKYSHVMHIGSTVRGELAEGKDALDVIDAVLPAGTLSGAPKLRAAQIINDLEGCKRGVYGGAIGYIDLAGNMDTCIAIRLAFAKGGRVFVRSGAGIVADSDPAKEDAECVNKAAAVVEAIRATSGGIA